MRSDRTKKADDRAAFKFLRDAIKEACDAIDASEVHELEEFSGLLPTDEKKKRVLDKVRFLTSASLSDSGLTVPPSREVAACYSRLNTRLIGRVFAVAASLAILMVGLHAVQVQRHSAYFAKQAREAEQKQDLARLKRNLHAVVCLNPDDKVAAQELEAVRGKMLREMGGAWGSHAFVIPEPSSMILFIVGWLLVLFFIRRRRRAWGRG